MLAPIPWGLRGSYECDRCGKRFRARAGAEGALLGAAFLLPVVLLGGHADDMLWIAWGALFAVWIGVSLGWRRGKWGEQETLFTGAVIGFFWMIGIATSGAPWARGLVEGGNDDRTFVLCMVGGLAYAYLARLAGLLTMGELREEGRGPGPGRPEPRPDRPDR
jgi:hypothetical protein